MSIEEGFTLPGSARFSDMQYIPNNNFNTTSVCTTIIAIIFIFFWIAFTFIITITVTIVIVIIVITMSVFEEERLLHAYKQQL